MKIINNLNPKATAALERLCDPDNIELSIKVLTEMNDFIVAESSEPDLDPQVAVERIDLLNALRELRQSLIIIREGL